MSVHESISTLGVVVGSVIGGLLYQRYSMAVVYLFCIAVALFGAMIQIVLFKTLSEKTPAEGSAL